MIESLLPATKHVFAPASKKSSPKSNAVSKPHMFHGTPQMADPSSLIKVSLKNKVKAELEERVSKLPTSPYEMVEEQTENGSPVYSFNKVNVPK